ncbi:hypothetical protein HQ939_05950 [Glaesserella parasuis]|uniref:hypothetical protein n=1 Tax=Glaesserella parasuis TaxID=738 RepID=UPI00156AF0E4|nr:hypothetical protein [Glaesserella parasuis]QKJ69790.1 hypothetical protein HQ939_05950 [Glaesserella parasuis]
MKIPTVTKEEKALYYILDKFLLFIPIVWRVGGFFAYLFCFLGLVFLLVSLVVGDLYNTLRLLLQVLFLLFICGAIEFYIIPQQLPKWRKKIKDKINSPRNLFDKF